MDLKSPLAWAKQFIGYCQITSLTYTRNIIYFICRYVIPCYQFKLSYQTDILYIFKNKHTLMCYKLNFKVDEKLPLTGILFCSLVFIFYLDDISTSMSGLGFSFLFSFKGMNLLFGTILF